MLSMLVILVAPLSLVREHEIEGDIVVYPSESFRRRLGGSSSTLDNVIICNGLRRMAMVSRMNNMLAARGLDGFYLQSFSGRWQVLDQNYE